MSQVMLGQHAATLMLEKLGIPIDNVSEVSILMKPNEVCAVTIKRLVKRSELSAFFDEVEFRHPLQLKLDLGEEQG